VAVKLVRRDLDLTSVEAARRIAKRKLPFSVYRFIEGGNEDEQTVRANREGFQEIGFRPRVPHDRVPRDLRTTVLGQELSMPVVISPAGFIRSAHPEGELAVARAAAAAGIAIGVSTLASYRPTSGSRCTWSVAAPEPRSPSSAHDRPVVGCW
jgi:isopentenyl diphosphate isomerase/L-lactate dehydrogenase-like FMN-dependent dehydrogenase